MPPEAPKLDTRTYDDLVDQVETLAEATTPWRRAQPGESLDFGGALIRIFGRMMERTIARLNQVPEKNFLAFLDLLGTQILPPKPARVPLTFELAKGRSAPTVIPAGTRVAATLTAEETDDILFETEQALVATPAQIAAAYVLEPSVNRYADLSSVAKPDIDQSLPMFRGISPRDYSLYLESILFGLEGNKTITLTLRPPIDQSQDLTLSLYQWFEADHAWRLIGPPSTASGPQLTLNLSDRVAGHTLVIGEDRSIDGHWIKLSFHSPRLGIQPNIQTVKVALTVAGDDVKPDYAFANNTEIDLTLPFYPFGPQPKSNDTFYIGHNTAFAYPNSTITLSLAMANPPGVGQPPIDTFTVRWEALTANQWRSITPSGENAAQKLAGEGSLAFQISSQKLIQAKEKNKQSRWLRARIIESKYEFSPPNSTPTATTLLQGITNANVITVANTRGFVPGMGLTILSDGNSDSAQITIVNTVTRQITLNRRISTNYKPGAVVQLLGTVSPPRINSLSIAYTYNTGSINPTYCLSSRDFVCIDHTAAIKDNEAFQPFQSPPDESPAFYMGFDRPLGTQPITLFVALEPPPAEAASRHKTDARLLWDYKTPEGWRRLSLIDGTNTFSESGLLTFLPPPDFARTIAFGQLCHWIRVRWVEGEFQAMPRLRRLLTNTVWATQAIATTEEILGSSNGEPDQVFQTAQTPVLLGQTLFVRERELPAPAEALALRQALGPGAIQPIEGVGGDRQGAWVQWQAVPDFYGSNGGDRHYILDYLTGQIYFGNDQAGRVPPQGRNNIRLSYRTGGGSQGNRPAGNILQLKSTVPYIKSVTNLEPARGGADAESLEQIKQRGPKQIRHRFRAVTVQDYEDLAYEASSEVARARAFPPRSYDLVLNNPLNRRWITPGDVDNYKNRSTHPQIENVGEVEIIIVPDSPVPQPIPSLDLINQVKTYLLNHSDKVMTLNVRGPIWIPVTITVDIVPTSLQTAVSLDTRVIDRLNEFLHPLTGGMNRLGWAFGRRPQDSDIYALLGSMAGVDHVRRLNMVVGDASESRLSAQQFALVFSGQHQVNLSPLEVNR